MDQQVVDRTRDRIGFVGSGWGAHRYRTAAAIALATVIFAIDSFTSLGSAVAVLYVLVIVIAGDVGDRRAIRFCSAVCILLTVISFIAVHGFHSDTQALLRLLFSLSANLVTTALLLRRRNDLIALKGQARLLELTSDAIFLRDAAGKVIYWNRGAEALYGWSEKEAIGRDADQLLPATFPISRNEAEFSLLANGSWQGELVVRTKSGRTVDIFTRWQLERNTSRGIETVLETAIDISERKASEAALKASEHRYRTIFETLAVAVWEHDLRDVKAELSALRARGVTDVRKYLAEHPEFVRRMRRLVRVTDVNETALKLMDIERKQDFFSRLDEFLPDSDTTFAQCLVAIDEGHPTFQAETTVVNRSGRIIPVIVMLSFPPDGTPLDRIQASVIDITERLDFQEALETSRRELESASRAAMIGEISASIAHEVNQPLAAIMAFVQAAQRWLKRDQPDLEEARLALNEAIVSTEHASEVVKRVRMLLGKAKPDTGEVAVDAAVFEAISLKRKELAAHDVDLEVDLRAGPALIQADRVLLQQTFLNVITNAMQAMEMAGSPERKLTIRTQVDDEGLLIGFADTGSGIDAETGEALFKAFNTTKPNGMGLGLAMCRSIVTAHGGTISLSNRGDRKGAVVEIRIPGGIYYPAAEGPVHAAAPSV
ncbi:PAS domain-containing sensor histidine kinase [Mycoplana rhizolycopersici]|uniref:histidine kinase n=1 Tax=Mycoplana rhizolycopersici TaxID=2746702 RepID=A0ABX2QHK7_9HYPH|nr:PAS domain S-box protein [Rhizobium rhizolycopersici]NVP57265.1 PAS domain S-box protein [Rhizobium rhizolycopersici]